MSVIRSRYIGLYGVIYRSMGTYKSYKARRAIPSVLHSLRFAALLFPCMYPYVLSMIHSEFCFPGVSLALDYNNHVNIQKYINNTSVSILIPPPRGYRNLLIVEAAG